MKKIIDHLVENGKELRVDQYDFFFVFISFGCCVTEPFFISRYLILFLKFVSAIIPTIDYDYTISMDG